MLLSRLAFIWYTCGTSLYLREETRLRARGPKRVRHRGLARNRNMSNRRVPIQIIADILRIEEGGKTEIGLFADIGYHQLENYLGYLADKGFIELENHRRRSMYRVTARGRELLLSIDQVTNSLAIEGSYCYH